MKLLDEDGAVILTLRDNGRGFKPDQVERTMGHGLRNMQDRTTAIGGRLAFNSSGGTGTEVQVRLPKPAGG